MVSALSVGSDLCRRQHLCGGEDWVLAPAWVHAVQRRCLRWQSLRPAEMRTVLRLGPAESFASDWDGATRSIARDRAPLPPRSLRRRSMRRRERRPSLRKVVHLFLCLSGLDRTVASASEASDSADTLGVLTRQGCGDRCKKGYASVSRECQECTDDQLHRIRVRS